MTTHAVLFDFDGTIMDSDTAIFGAWQQVFRAHGAEMGIDVVERLAGTTDAHWSPSDDIHSQTGVRHDAGALEREYGAIVEPLIARLGPMAGVEDRLEEARALGLRIACASSSTHAWVEGHLERLGLRHYFETVRCREDVPRTKPDPALFTLAARDLGVPPTHAFVLEDSLNGVRAAKAGGFYAIAIPTVYTAKLDLSMADMRVASMEELRFADVVTKLGR